MKARRKSVWDTEFPFSPAAMRPHYGWFVAFAGAMGIVASIPGQTIGVNVFSDQLVLHLGLTRREVSDAYFWGTLASGLALPFVGFWYDRLGARKLAVGANVFLGLSLFYLSQVDFFAGIFSQGEGNRGVWFALIVGFFLIRFWGQGQVTLCSRNMVGKWWREHRGKVLSLSGIAVGGCFSLTPIAFDRLITALGWREAWMVLGLVSIFGFGLLSWLFYRDNPEECGLEVDGGLPPKDRGEGDGSEFKAVRDFDRGEALRSYSFWAFSLIFGLQGLYYTAFAFHVVDIGRDIGFSKDVMLSLFIPQTIVGSGVSLFVGWASDRWRLKWLMSAMALGIVIASLGMYWENGIWTPITFVLGMSIAGGCFGTLSGAFMPRFFGFSNLGKISAVFMSMLVIASAIGPSGFSIVYDTWGTYRPAHLVAACLALALAVAVMRADNPQRKLAAKVEGP